MYITNMGGVDEMNNNISDHRIGIRAQKWCCLFTWLFDASIHNALELARP